ncbi:MAG: RagB/SusD family nutrient uptake outer membrane protein [Ferruginibacter sp.]
MRYIKILLALTAFSFVSCKKVIDLYPESNLNSATYFSNAAEVQAGVNGCYNALQKPMAFEWQVTELRSDNTDQGVPSSNNTTNRDLSDLDEFIPSTGHAGIYSYWINTYFVIRTCNTLLDKLGVVYDPASGNIALNPVNIPISDSVRKQFAGEAMVLRANSYFNLVRLFGGVFLIHTPVSPDAAKAINRSSVDDIYKLIKADLTNATTWLSPVKFPQITAANTGKVNAWVAKGLLAKVYLTLNDKASAIPLLQDVITNSGYSLQTTYANVFSIATEMNSEIMFAVRYKAGNLGLGSPFGNSFAPLGSGSAVINGSGLGYNYPTNDIDTALTTADARKAVAMGSYGATKLLYVKKFLTPVATANDGESDWPVLRYADIILMMAEAQGYTPASITLINSVRARTSLGNLPASVNSVATLKKLCRMKEGLNFHLKTNAGSI